MTDNNDLSTQEINDIIDESNPPDSNIIIVDEPLSPSIVTNIYNWVPTTSGNYNWNDSNNWSGPIPSSFPNSSTDTARIVGPLSGGSGVINLNQNISLYDLYIGAESYWNGSSWGQENYTINGGSPSGTLTVSSGIRFPPEIYTYSSSPSNSIINTNIRINHNAVIRAPSQTQNSLIFNGSIIANNLTTNLFLGNTSASTDNLGGSLIFNGVIQDDISNILHLRKHGNSAVSLLGANTYSGSTILTQTTNVAGTGLVIFNSIEDIGSINPSSFGKPLLANEKIILGNGAAVGAHIVYTGSGHSSNRSIFLNNYTGTTTISADGSGPLILDGAISTALAPANNFTIQRNLVFRGTGLGYFPGIPTQLNLGITNLQKRDSGMWIFTDTNNYTGYTYVYGGILQFNKRTGLYNGNTSDWVKASLGPTGILQPKIVVIQDSNATLAFNVGGPNEFTNSDITTLINNLAGQISDPVAGSGGLRRTSYWGFDTTNASGNIFTIPNNIANTTGSFSGSIGVRKLGSNTLVLSGNNSYTHETIIHDGTLKITNPSGLGLASGPITIYSGVLDLNNLTIAKDSIIAVSSGIVTNGNINGSYTFRINDEGSCDAILYGSGSLIKYGDHTITIDNTNYYSGYTEIRDGTIEINSISNSGIPGSFGIGKFINTSWQPGYSDTPPTILYTGSGDVSSNKDFNIFSTFTKIESNSPSGSISFTGKIYAQPTRRKDYSYLTQIGPTFSAWLPADPANYIPNPYVWSFNVFRFTSTTNYVSAETLSALIPAVVDTNNPPETFFFNNRKEIIDLIKVQLGVVDISSPPYYPYYGSPLTVDTYWQSYSSDQLNLCGSSKSSKNTMNLVRVFDPYGSTPSLPIVKTGSGTWSLTGQSSIILSLFPITHKEGTLIINSQTAGSYQPFVIEGNNTNNDILLLFDTPPESLNTSTFVVKNIPNNKQNIYIGSITKHNEYIGIGSLSDRMFIDNAITLMANKYLVVESRINGSYELGYDVPNPANHDIYIGTPEYRGSVIITSIISSKSILVNYGSLLMNSYGWDNRAEIERCYLNNSTSLGGQGPLKGLVEGPGNICPSVSPILGPDLNVNHGFLAIQQLDPSEGTNFHFTFSDTDIGWIYIDQYTRFISNDVLCLCDIIYQPDYYNPDPVPPDGIANRLVTSLSPSNEINLYFPSSIEHGQTYKGGFLVQDEPNLVSKLSNATYNLYVKTNSGNIVYNGQNYALLNSNYSVTVNTEFYSESDLSEEIGLLPIPSGYLSTFTINVT